MVFWRRTAIALAVVGIAMGCATFDPWAEARQVAGAPSAAVPVPGRARAAAPGSRASTVPLRTDRPLGLAECVSIALERNPATRSLWLASRAAAARVGEERAAYLPVVTLTASGTRQDDATLRAQAAAPGDEFVATLGVSYALFDGGTRSARVAAAEADRVGGAMRHAAVLQDVALEVALAYHERLAGEALVKVAEETVRQTQYHVDLARARQQSGLAARFDVLKTETERADAGLGLVRARSGARIAEGRFAQALGLRVGEAPAIKNLPDEAPAHALAAIEPLLDEAARGRPELAAALAGVDARRADVRAATAKHLPVVTVGADYGFRNDRLSGSWNDRHEWTVGLAVTFPLFQGFAAEYGRQRAKAEAERAAVGYDIALRGVELEVWTAYARLVEGVEAVEAARALVASAEESARVAEGMYKAGAASIIELVDSQAARTAARTRGVQATLDLHAAMARFDRAIGRTRTK